MKLMIDTVSCSSVVFNQPFCGKLFQNNHLSYSAEYLLKLWETSKFRFGIIFVRLYIHSCLMFQRKRKLRTIELWNSGFTLGDYASLCSIFNRVEDWIYWNRLKDRSYLLVIWYWCLTWIKDLCLIFLSCPSEFFCENFNSEKFGKILSTALFLKQNQESLQLSWPFFLN